MEPPLLSLALWNHSSGSQQEDGGRDENIPVFPPVSSLAPSTPLLDLALTQKLSQNQPW